MTRGVAVKYRPRPPSHLDAQEILFFLDEEIEKLEEGCDGEPNDVLVIPVYLAYQNSSEALVG